MKKVILLMILFINTFVFAQQKEMNLEPFNVVKVYDRINLILIEDTQEQERLTLNGINANDVQVIQNGNELKIRLPLTKLLQGEDIECVLYYHNIHQIEVNEGSKAEFNDVINTKKFVLNAKEGSEVTLKINSDYLDTKIGSGAHVELSGNTTKHNVIINTGAILEAELLKTKETSVTCNAGGEADVYASDKVIAKTRAGGVITIHGKPSKIDRKTVLGGNIRTIEEINEDY